MFEFSHRLDEKSHLRRLHAGRASEHFPRKLSLPSTWSICAWQLGTDDEVRTQPSNSIPWEDEDRTSTTSANDEIDHKTRTCQQRSIAPIAASTVLVASWPVSLPPDSRQRYTDSSEPPSLVVPETSMQRWQLHPDKLRILCIDDHDSLTNRGAEIA
nr:hypothetical protein CFP56_09024 [Quercus suber]